MKISYNSLMILSYCYGRSVPLLLINWLIMLIILT